MPQLRRAVVVNIGPLLCDKNLHRHGHVNATMVVDDRSTGLIHFAVMPLLDPPTFGGPSPAEEIPEDGPDEPFTIEFDE